jgi:recombination protein RecA
MPRAEIAPSVVSAASPTEYEPAKFISSGSTLLDLVLGGGWAQGRVSNIVGDKSTGKTLLAIEATANFKRKSRLDRIRYGEAEAAFDRDYAQTMGLPKDISLSEEMRTVEDFHKDLDSFMTGLKGTDPALYVLDSLDSLTDDAELERELGDATYGTAKAKLMSEFFRRSTRSMASKNCSLMVISQIRDKIGVTFGETKTRGGGKALDFYCSQIIWLAEIGKLKRTYQGIDRVVGLTILAKCKKNKVGPAYRDAEIDLIFGYGIDDDISMLKWLKKAKVDISRISNHTAEQWPLMIADARRRQDRASMQQLNRILRGAVVDRWLEVDQHLAPPCSKYGDE